MAYLKGIGSIERSIRVLKGRVRRAAKRALIAATFKVRAESSKIVPVDTGNLRDSVGSGIASSTYSYTLGYVGYGVNYHVDYAVAVHEELRWRHAPGKRAKFLEVATLESSRYLPVVYREYLKEVF